MITKDFEEYFPLPWHILFYGDGIHFIDSEKGSGFWIVEDREGNAAKKQDSAEGRAAMQYMIKCGNLMPEAVVLFGIVEEVLTLCATRTFDAETKHLLSHTAEAVQTFKKKLEGGAEDATNP